ncbi:glycosyltransferase family 4 protein [Patescibacteria group bacterium]
MKVCFFGIYDSTYSRNRVLMDGFRAHGYEVFECKVDPKQFGKFGKFYALLREYKKIKHLSFDYVIVAFPGHSMVWLARILFGKGVIFDAFVSLYNSIIEDRKNYKKYNPKALYYWFIDWFSCALASKVLLDTNTHINYFVKTFHLSRKKFIKVFVGTTTDIFYPQKIKKDTEEFTIHFHGSFIPLQGIEYIIRAAKLLEDKKDTHFRIIGNGPEYKKMQLLAKKLNIHNVEWIPRISLNELAEYINRADIVLGIFGSTSKTELVIPNKVYEAIACGKPVITAKTLAMQEMFVDGEHVLFVEKANPNDLAKKIIGLKNNTELQKYISDNSYKLFTQELSPDSIVRNILL